MPNLKYKLHITNDVLDNIQFQKVSKHNYSQQLNAIKE